MPDNKRRERETKEIHFGWIAISINSKIVFSFDFLFVEFFACGKTNGGFNHLTWLTTEEHRWEWQLRKNNTWLSRIAIEFKNVPQRSYWTNGNVDVSSVCWESVDKGFPSSLKWQIDRLNKIIESLCFSPLLTQNPVKYSKHWKNQPYVDKEVNVYENDVQYDAHHLNVRVIVNTSNCLHYVVLNNLLMNRRFSDRDRSQWKKMRHVDNYNLNKDEKHHYRTPQLNLISLTWIIWI